MATSARIDELKKRFDENPRRFFAPLANEYRKAGDLEQAIALCRQHLAEQPSNLNGQIVFGQALFDAGEHAEARVAFEAAIGLDPENLIALRHLGEIARSAGDVHDARGWFQRVLDADPRNDEIAATLKELEALAVADTVIVDAPAAAEVGRDPFAPPAAAAAADAASAAAPLALEPMVPGSPTAEDPAAAPTIEFVPPVVPRPTPAAPTPVVAAPVVTEAVEAPAAGHELLDLEPTAFAPPDAPGDAIPAAAQAAHGGPDLGGWDDLAADAAGASSFNEPESAPASAFGDSLDVPPDLESADAPPSVPPSAVPSPADGDLAALFGDSGFSGDPVDVGDVPPPEFVHEVDPGPVAASAVGDETPQAFVTETMAELYLQQGFRDQALEVYRQLASQHPDDAGLAERVRQLEAGGRASLAVAAVEERVVEHAAVRAGEETARSFFRRLADHALVGQGGAATAPPTDPGALATPTTAVPTAAAVAAASSPVAAPPAGGSLDQLFGVPASPDDERAAAALSSAFGSPPAEPVAPPSGRPTRPAADDFSLDRVFRGETARSSGTAPTPRASEALRFDQFFAAQPDPGAPPPPDGANTPADAGDLAQFQSWLTGLKGQQ